MVLLIPKKKHLFQNVHVKGHIGGTLLSSVGNVLSGSLQNSNFLSNIGKTLGSVAIGSLASYGIKKGLDYISGDNQKTNDVTNNTPLTVAEIPQGTLKGDILPVTTNITRVNPENHYIDLPDGMKKKTTDIVFDATPKKRTYVKHGTGLSRRTKKGGNIDRLLNDKSKEILYGLKNGSGIFNF